MLFSRFASAEHPRVKPNGNGRLSNLPEAHLEDGTLQKNLGLSWSELIEMVRSRHHEDSSIVIHHQHHISHFCQLLFGSQFPHSVPILLTSVFRRWRDHSCLLVCAAWSSASAVAEPIWEHCFNVINSFEGELLESCCSYDYIVSGILLLRSCPPNWSHAGHMHGHRASNDTRGPISPLWQTTI